MDLVLVHAVPKEYCTATIFTKALNAAHQITPSPCFETGIVISPTCFLHTRKIARQRIHSKLILYVQSAALIHQSQNQSHPAHSECSENTPRHTSHHASVLNLR